MHIKFYNLVNQQNVIIKKRKLLICKRLICQCDLSPVVKRPGFKQT